MLEFISLLPARTLAAIAGVFALFMPQPAQFVVMPKLAAHEDVIETVAPVAVESPFESGLIAAAAASQSSDSATNTESTSTPLRTYDIAVDDSKVKGALVNILCQSRRKGLPSMSGSGVVIHPSGVILTNAHVGQYFLLTEYSNSGTLKCVIRTGNPARTSYTAEILHFPAAWLDANPRSIVGNRAKGTGENDYAFLRISGTATSDPLPTEFPYLPYATVSPKEGSTVAIAGYPAEFIPDSLISKKLYPLWAPTEIVKTYTFERSTVDLVAVRGSYIAQRGSSGGAMIDADGDMTGLIATASTKLYENERRLYVITMGHIDRSLRENSEMNLEELLSGPIAKKALRFSMKQTPALERALVAEIERPATTTATTTTI